MDWTTIGRSATSSQTPPKVEWKERAVRKGGDRCATDRTVDFAHVRGLAARPIARTNPAAPAHSAKNWARLLADLRSYFER